MWARSRYLRETSGGPEGFREQNSGYAAAYDRSVSSNHKHVAFICRSGRAASVFEIIARAKIFLIEK